ncbi:MAG: hypothetical protein LH618_01695 [Saprospiraceae bacterium]|nr:hypothetical protein [Saprospiraceae bacterium]
MSPFFATLLRTVLVFGSFLGIQYFIPYYLLAVGGILSGFFVLKTSNDRPTGLALIIGSVLFAIFAYLWGQVHVI